MREISKDIRRPITDEIKQLAREDEWSEHDIERGYAYFNTELGLFKPCDRERCWRIQNALHIETIGIMGVFDSDEDAALYGENFFGEKIFHYDLGEDEEISLYWFVDEPTTRATVEEYLAEKYGENHGFTPVYETESERKTGDSTFFVQMTFFESPNFSMFDSRGETVVVQTCGSYQEAEAVAKAHALDLLRELNRDKTIASIEECEDKDFHASFGGVDFCAVRFGDVFTNIVNIIDARTGQPAHKSEVCPRCGCDPEAEPYCMAPGTHCPMCGYAFKN